MANKSTCKHKYKGIGIFYHEYCPYPIYKNGLCIFHLPKYSQNKITRDREKVNTQKLEKDFEEHIYNLLKYNEQNSKVISHDFIEFEFPNLKLTRKTIEEILCEKELKKPLLLVNALFKGDADFSGTIFKSAYFDGARFNKAYFSNTTFKQKSSFRETVFDNVDFGLSTFNSFVRFWHLTTNYANFRQSTFEGNVEFNGAKFFKNVDFRWCSFKGLVIFFGIKDYSCFLGKCNFKSVNLDKEAKIIFDKINLDNTILIDTDLSKIDFKDVKWYKPQKVFTRREIALWDEFIELEKSENIRDYVKISESYHQLVRNYEKKRDFYTADQFHIGEMEVQRKMKGAGTKSKIYRNIKEWLNTYNIYRVLSNYGTSFWHAFIVLLLLVFVLFPLLFLIPSFRPMPSTPDSPQLIKNYWDSISFTISTLPISNIETTQYKGLGAQIMSAVTIIVLSSQFAILLLAIRRRFKR